MFDTHACHIRALLSGSFSKNQILTNTSDEQVLYPHCFTYSLLWVSAISYILQRQENLMLLPCLFLLGCCPKHKTTLQKSVKLVRMRHLILSFYYIMEYIYISIYINIISAVLDPSEFCTAFFPEVGANPLWCNLKHRLCCSTATPALHCPKHLPEGQEGPIHISK